MFIYIYVYIYINIYKLNMDNSELHCLPGLYVHMRHSGQSAKNL